MSEKEVIILIIAVFATIVLLCISFIILLFIYRKRKIDSHQEKENMRIEFQQQQMQMELEIQSQTMQEIGREIHDNVGQKLTLASLYTSQLDYDNEYPQIHSRINNISNIINESLNELRALSKSLISQNIEQQSLRQLLETEIKKIGAAGGYTCDVNIAGSNGHSTLLKTIIYRTVQEFFQNSLKHAAATHISLRLETGPHGIQLFLQDNGKGFQYDSTKNYKGSGIENMKKRAAIIGAQFQYSAAINTGTTLALFIPHEKI